MCFYDSPIPLHDDSHVKQRKEQYTLPELKCQQPAEIQIAPYLRVFLRSKPFTQRSHLRRVVHSYAAVALCHGALGALSRHGAFGALSRHGATSSLLGAPLRHNATPLRHPMAQLLTHRLHVSRLSKRKQKSHSRMLPTPFHGSLRVYWNHESC